MKLNRGKKKTKKIKTRLWRTIKNTNKDLQIEKKYSLKM